MAPSNADHARALDDLLTTTLAALTQFTTFLTPDGPSTATPEPIQDPPHPLHVLRDSALLVKAHTTKLSLLAINKPFTPSAIAKVLQQLSATCLPAMMSAVQICSQEKAVWGELMAREVQSRVRRVFREMETLLRELQSIAQGGAGRRGGGGRRDSLSSTGVLWESCDALVELDRLGLPGLAVQKAEQYRDTLKDAIEELKEWAEGEDPDTEGQDELLDGEDEGVDGDRESVEDIFHAANSMPSDRPELKRLVEEADRKLKKIVLLYTAVIKRRLKTFKPSSDEAEKGGPSNVLRLDESMQSLKRIPHQVDELASCFYDLDEARVKEMLQKCVSEAKKARGAVVKSWTDEEDEFTAWSAKWLEAVG